MSQTSEALLPQKTMLEFFPDPYPDELLYSVWTRLSDQARYSSRDQVMQELFGKRVSNLLIDWSCSLDALINRLPIGHGYTADLLIEKHTLFPLYAPFLSPERRERISCQLRSGDGKSLLARMGMLTSGIPAYRWLRYCPACVQSDRESFGETYWHRLHQAPGVALCPVHATFLEDSPVARPIGRAMFFSAEQALLEKRARCAIASPFYSVLNALAGSIKQLLDSTYVSLGPAFCTQQYLALLDHDGFVTVRGHLRVVELVQAFLAHYPPSLLALLHCDLDQTRSPTANWLARLPLHQRVQHPLHHLLLILFLGSSPDQFLRVPIAPSLPFGEGPWPCLNPICDYYHVSCIQSHTRRANHAKQIPSGVFACPHCGFTYSRVGPDRTPEDAFRRDRIPVYGPVWEGKLREWWADATLSVNELAHRLGVSWPTATFQATRLHLPPREARRLPSRNGQQKHRDRTQCREEWVKLVEEYGEDGLVGFIHRVKGAQLLYNWLNKFDREWLCVHCPPPLKPQRTKEAPWTVDGESLTLSRQTRDAQMAQAIRQTAPLITNAPGKPQKVTRVQLEKAISTVGWFITRPERYPLTAQAYQDVKETPEAFALRRIAWAVACCREQARRPTRKQFLALSGTIGTLPSVQVALEEALRTLEKESR